MNQQTTERSLSPSNALALEIIRNHAGINRYQADMHLGHGSLTQRVSDLGDMGFQFATEYRKYVDLTGNERKGVAHYTLLGWRDPSEQTAA